MNVINISFHHGYSGPVTRWFVWGPLDFPFLSMVITINVITSTICVSMCDSDMALVFQSVIIFIMTPSVAPDPALLSSTLMLAFLTLWDPHRVTYYQLGSVPAPSQIHLQSSLSPHLFQPQFWTLLQPELRSLLRRRHQPQL